MNGEQFPPNGRSARVIEVIEVVTKEGDSAAGTVVREVTRYYSTDGELLATRDIDDPSIPPELQNTDTWYQHLNARANARMANIVPAPAEVASDTDWLDTITSPGRDKRT